MNKSKASKAASALAKRKHSRLTKEERSASGRKAAQARWRAVRERQRQVDEDRKRDQEQERRDTETD